MTIRTTLLAGVATLALAGSAFAQSTDATTETETDAATGTLIVEGAESEASEDATMTAEGDDAAVEAETDTEVATDGEQLDTTTTQEGGAMVTTAGGDGAATTGTGMTTGTDAAAGTDVADAASAGLYGTFADRAVSDIVGMDVLARSDNGEEMDEVGEVERLVRTATSEEVLAVVGIGGFLGLGEHDVAVPLARFQESEEGLVLPEFTEEELEAMAPFEDGDGIEELTLDMTVAGTPVAPVEGETSMDGTMPVEGDAAATDDPTLVPEAETAPATE